MVISFRPRPRGRFLDPAEGGGQAGRYTVDAAGTEDLDLLSWHAIRKIQEVDTMGWYGKPPMKLLSLDMRQFLLAVGIVTAGIAGPAEARIFGDVIPDAASAVKVARVMLESYTGDSVNLDFKATLEGDTWHVVSVISPVAEGGDPRDVVITVGGSSIDLSRHDGRVLDIQFSK
jgi:hypothetical protein